MVGWEKNIVNPPKTRKTTQTYQDLVQLIREKKPACLRLNPNLVDTLYREHCAYHPNPEEELRPDGRPPLVIEGCLIIPEWPGENNG